VERRAEGKEIGKGVRKVGGGLNPFPLNKVIIGVVSLKRATLRAHADTLLGSVSSYYYEGSVKERAGVYSVIPHLRAKAWY